MLADSEQARGEIIRLYIDGHILKKEAEKRIGLGSKQSCITVNMVYKA